MLVTEVLEPSQDSRRSDTCGSMSLEPADTQGFKYHM